MGDSAGTKNISNRSYSLNSVNGDYIGDYLGDYYRGYEGDAGRLGYSSSEAFSSTGQGQCRQQENLLRGEG